MDMKIISSTITDKVEDEVSEALRTGYKIIECRTSPHGCGTVEKTVFMVKE